MASFDDALARMKALYTYGKDLNENKTMKPYTLEHSATAADGRVYGIIKECNKYYIKVAQNGKETLAENYNYIGGFCNKSNYEYDSYNKALKNFELKLSSINEACEGNVITSTLDPFKKGEFIVEGTDRLKNEIARQRQIMYNVSMLMNEATEIGASRKDDVVMFDGKNPEAETGKKGDEEMKKTEAKPEYAGSKTNGLDKKVAPFHNEPGKCEDQLKEACDCGKENCTCDWGSKGLPSTPGVGEADTDHNNNPFVETVNESEEDFDIENDIEVDAEEDFDTEDDIEMGIEDDDMDFDTEEDLDVEDFDSEENDEIADDEEEFEDEDNSIMSRIAELEAELEALKSQLNNEEEVGMEDDAELDVDIESDEEMDSEEELNEGYFDDEFEDNEDSYELDKFLKDPKNQLPKDIKVQTDFEADFNDVDDEDEFAEEDFEDMEDFEDEMDECGSLMESKKRYMNSIVESVTKQLMKEDELHVFGKHPGYRKKPMNLPTTGEDKNQWGEDWNDESVYSEEPFGSKIGDSAPYNMLVDVVTKDVMATLSGEAFKKKMK